MNGMKNRPQLMTEAVHQYSDISLNASGTAVISSNLQNTKADCGWKAPTACPTVLSRKETRQVRLFVNQMDLYEVFTDVTSDLFHHPACGFTNCLKSFRPIQVKHTGVAVRADCKSKAWLCWCSPTGNSPESRSDSPAKERSGRTGRQAGRGESLFLPFPVKGTQY